MALEFALNWHLELGIGIGIRRKAKAKEKEEKEKKEEEERKEDFRINLTTSNRRWGKNNGHPMGLTFGSDGMYWESWDPH